MFCSFCEGYKMKISLFEEHSQSLEEKIVQLKRINNALLDTLKNCQSNDNWKFQYEQIQVQNYGLEKKLKILEKCLAQRNHRSEQRFNNFSERKNDRTQLGSRVKLEDLCQTPKSKASKLSSQKMSNFMSTLTKKKSAKLSLYKQSDTQKMFKSRHFIQTPRSTNYVQPFGGSNHRKINVKGQKQQKFKIQTKEKHDQLDQIFSFKDHHKTHKASDRHKKKTLVEILVFE